MLSFLVDRYQIRARDLHVEERRLRRQAVVCRDVFLGVDPRECVDVALLDGCSTTAGERSFPDLASLRRRLAERREEGDQLVRLFGRGAVDVERLERSVKAVQAEERALQRRISELEAKQWRVEDVARAASRLESIAIRLRSRLEDMPLDQRAEVLGLLRASLLVYPLTEDQRAARDAAHRELQGRRARF